MKSKTKHDFIGDVIALINSEEYEASIKTMSADCNVPLPYMRKAMLAILSNHVLQSCLYTNDDYNLEDDESSFIEDFQDDPETYGTNLLNGDYDNIVWEMNLRILDTSEDEILTLTHMEYGAIKLMKEDALSLKRGSLFEKKETINPISAEVRKNKKTIMEAIDRNAGISFIYSTKNNITEQVKCYPTELFTNVNDNWVYFSSSEGKRYRLDRIFQGCKIVQDVPTPSETVPQTNLKYAWGSYYNESDIPQHVKVRITPETRNIIPKIKNDTSYRNETSKLYQQGDYYYYEDDIIGMPEFQRWVRGYGSSMVVIEPLDMRNNIVERARQTLQYYNQATEWKDL